MLILNSEAIQPQKVSSILSQVVVIVLLSITAFFFYRLDIVRFDGRPVGATFLGTEHLSSEEWKTNKSSPHTYIVPPPTHSKHKVLLRSNV